MATRQARASDSLPFENCRIIAEDENDPEVQARKARIEADRHKYGRYRNRSGSIAQIRTEFGYNLGQISDTNIHRPGAPESVSDTVKRTSTAAEAIQVSESQEAEPVEFYETANFRFRPTETYVLISNFSNETQDAFKEYLDLVGNGEAFKPRRVMGMPFNADSFIFDHYKISESGALIVYVQNGNKVVPLIGIGSFIAEEHILKNAQPSTLQTKKKEPAKLQWG